MPQFNAFFGLEHCMQFDFLPSFRSILLLPLLALSACGVAGSGTVVESTRTVSAFKKVSVSGGITLRGSLGARAVKIRADENLVQYIDVTVENEVLLVKKKSAASPTKFKAFEVVVANEVFEGVTAESGASVELAASRVESFVINLASGADARVSGIDSTSVNATVEAAATLMASGKAKNGRVTATGGATVDCNDLPLEALEIEVSSAELKARVSETVTGSVTAGGSVFLSGKATDRVTVSAGGEVKRVEP